MRWPKDWSFSFSISPSNEHPGLISFRMDWLDLLAVQGILKSLQHHRSKASILWHSGFFTVQLSHSYMTNGKNPKESIRILLELISEFCKGAGYKINTQKSLAFLYTNNEKSEREIKESIPFTTATKRIKYLGINLPKETNKLYTENYKTLTK